MQIVIEIPEEEYNTGQLVHYFGCYSDKLDLAIYNGTPLPEHHGRLIDLNDLYDFDRRKVEYAPTIIEADEESEE